MSEPEPIGAVLSQEACLARLWTAAQRHFPHVTEAKLIRYAHECIGQRDVQPFPDGGHFIRENLRDVALLLAAQVRDEASVPLTELGTDDQLICGYVLREIGVWLDDQREVTPWKPVPVRRFTGVLR